jgi:hypothetical protein
VFGQQALGFYSTPFLERRLPHHARMLPVPARRTFFPLATVAGHAVFVLAGEAHLGPVVAEQPRGEFVDLTHDEVHKIPSIF